MDKSKRRIRDFTWNDYGISTFRYRELKNFCLQYDEKKSKIHYGLNGVSNNGMPKGNSMGNPVEVNAISNTVYKRDCEMIEEAARQACPEFWRYIVKSVTNDLPYELIEYDEQQGRIPIGKTDFYGYRRLFYKNLHNLKLGTN
nr:MAG TPA: hypothetical protein [Caudoviricetes sp.]